jgi:hypothetical protein
MVIEGRVSRILQTRRVHATLENGTEREARGESVRVNEIAVPPVWLNLRLNPL